LNNRIDYLDIVKGLGIIFVVIGHSGLLLSKFVYLFHIPLFFFISGYFYQDKYTLNFSDFIIKRIKSLYIPFVKFELLFLAAHNIFYNLNIYNNAGSDSPEKLYNASDYISNIISIAMLNGSELLLAPLWFITALFTVNIMFWIISKVSLKYGMKWKPVFVVFCFCLGNLFTKLKIGIIQNILFVPELLNVSMVAVFIFYLGYLYRKHECKFIFNSKPLIMCSLLILLLLREYGVMDMRVNSYPNPAFMLIGSLLGIYLTIYISKNISNVHVKEILKYTGNHTMSIMAFHLLCFKVVSLLQIKILGLPFYLLGNFGQPIQRSWWGILYSMAGVGIPLMLIYIKNGVSVKIHQQFQKKSPQPE
jgi:fucose 4-O-acetylase-like acetyltransferase